MKKNIYPDIKKLWNLSIFATNFVNLYHSEGEKYIFY